jgi:hypothetical protein
LASELLNFEFRREHPVHAAAAVQFMDGITDSRALGTSRIERETVETVGSADCPAHTSIKRGVNESLTRLPESGSVLGRHWEKILAAIPFLILIWVVARYAIDVPYLDQWDFVPLIDKMYQGELTFHDLWMQFNEHRILFPKLVMLCLARLTHWNIRCESVVSVLFAIGVFLLLAWQIRASVRVFGQKQLRWALPACSLVAFSVSQYENFLWGWQLGLLLGLLASMGAILLLANRPFGWGKFAGAVVLGIVATYSFANGVLVWVIGFGLLCVNPADDSPLAAQAAPIARAALPVERAALRLSSKRVAIGIWSFAAAVCMGFYLWDYHKPAHHPQLTSIFGQPMVFISYVLKYIGGTCAQYGEGGVLPDRIWASVLGLAGLAVMGWAGWKMARRMRTNRAALAPYVAMCAYSLGTALMAAIARGGFGRGQALCSRYCSMTGPLWFSIIVMLILLSQKGEGASEVFASISGNPSPRPTGRGRTPSTNAIRIARWLLFGVVAFVAFSSGFAIRSAKELSGNLANGRRSVLVVKTASSLDDAHDELLVICPSPRTVIDGYRILSARGLSLCREAQ